MKTGIHPEYYSKVTAKCVCGATYDIGSTLSELSTEICSACHPFYTGKQKILDNAGRVDKFRQRQAAAEAKKQPKVEEEAELTDAATAEVKEPKAKAPAKKKATKKK